ncbi:MAG: DUF6596 domain-containing protein [Pseudomonadota bacterium]
MTDARAKAEEAARASYGRLLAWLSSRTHDVAAAEDALADAFKAALENWPKTGAPASPEAWLLTAARRKLIDAGRRRQTREAGLPSLVLAAEEAEAAITTNTDFPDERLKLMFICAHPAIDAAVRTPLMLQTVLGLDAARIASAFLVSPAGMGQRLVRAKKKIKAAGIPFEAPDAANLEERFDAVLDAVYAAFTASWEGDHSQEGHPDDLVAEAMFLSRLLTQIAPRFGEAWGLLSLLCHVNARRSARFVEGVYIPLSEQNTSLWDRMLIAEAEAALAKAWRLGGQGRYSLEAAIQSAHAAAGMTGRDLREDIVILYHRLCETAPSVGAQAARAAALAHAGRPREGLSILEAIETKRSKNYQTYWAVRAHLLSECGRFADAREAYDIAIGLTENSATRAFLMKRRAALATL